MELIIKTTGACNMACKFCAAANLRASEQKRMDPRIIDVIESINPNGIIVTGGDSLCCSTDWYLELFERFPDIQVDFVTNLKDFYLNPDKWTEIFRRDNIRVCTSFNYGNARMWDKDTVYDEVMFRKVMDLFGEKIGWLPMFISVIDYDNEWSIKKTVDLAKELGTQCRLNNAMKLGRQGIYYPRAKMFEHWLGIIEDGNEKFEINCQERDKGICPFNTSLLCKSTIRCLYIDEKNNLRYQNCEDRLNNLERDIPIEKDIVKPIEEKIPVEKTINPVKCQYCELYNLCNACETNREQAKKYSPEYCSLMLKNKDRIIRAGWKL